MKPLFSNRGFLAVWSAAFVSGLGDKIAILAFFSLVYDRTGDVASLGLLAAVQVLPAVLIGPAGGVLVDRWDRRRILTASEVFSALVVAAIPFVPSLAHVYVMAALLSVGRTLAGPARLALIPDVVPVELLNRANALFVISQNLILLLGMAAGGLIVQAVGTTPAFLIDAGTFVVSAAILAFAPLVFLGPGRERVAASARDSWREVRTGVVFLWGRAPLRYAVFFLALATLVTAMQPPLVYEFVLKNLGRNTGELGLIFATAGLGGLLGAVAAGLMRGAARPLRVVGLLMAVDGTLLVLFTLNTSLWPALLLFAAFGAVSSGIQINLATFLQRETPAELRGRVFGWLTPLLGPVTLLSVLTGPLLAAAVGVVHVLLAAGLAEVVFGLGGAWRAPLPQQDAAAASAAPPSLHEMAEEA